MSDLNEVVGEDVKLDAPETAEVVPEVVPEAPAEQAEPEAHAEPVAKTVPLAALHEERERRKELARELADSRRQQEEMTRRVQERLDALTKAQEQPAPGFEENPAGHLKHQIDSVQATLKQQQEAATKQREEDSNRQMVQQLAQRVIQDEAQVAAEKPDYLDAVKFLKAQRTRELVVMFGADEAEAMQQATSEFTEGALRHAMANRRPADVAYKMALARGYKPQQATATEKFEAQKAGVAAAKTLGGGGASKGALTATQLLSMSDEEFREATNTDAKWRKLMGG